MKTNMNATVGTRITKAMRRQFVSKAKKESGMGQSDILRALIHAYVEGRLAITNSTAAKK